jgi:hypothetical protein
MKPFDLDLPFRQRSVSWQTLGCAMAAPGRAGVLAEGRCLGSAGAGGCPRGRALSWQRPGRVGAMLTDKEDRRNECE